MEMNANWVAATASVVSALIIGVTAVAAFLQIRHVRNSNEITVFLRLVDRLDSLEAETTFAEVDAFVDRVETDAALRLKLSQSGRVDEFRSIASLLQFMEHLCTLIVMGQVTEDLVLAEYADNIDHLWKRLGPTIYLRRKARGPYVGVTFEHVAMRAKLFLEAGGMNRLYGRMLKDPRMSSPEFAA